MVLELQGCNWLKTGDLAQFTFGVSWPARLSIEMIEQSLLQKFCTESATFIDAHTILITPEFQDCNRLNNDDPAQPTTDILAGNHTLICNGKSHSKFLSAEKSQVPYGKSHANFQWELS